LLGAGALGALALAGCGDRSASPPRGGDPAVLGTVLAVQRALAGAWERVDPAVAEKLHGHVAALQEAGAAPGRAAPADVQRAVARVHGSGDRAALLEAEKGAGAALLSALPQVRGASARELVMSLYAAGAQHASLLLIDLGRDPLPDAFAGTL
jgi:prophage DNA circulation protein